MQGNLTSRTDFNNDMAGEHIFRIHAVITATIEYRATLQWSITIQPSCVGSFNNIDVVMPTIADQEFIIGQGR